MRSLPSLVRCAGALLLLALGSAPVAAQEGQDPFAARHNELARAVEFHLQQAGVLLPNPAAAALAEQNSTAGPGEAGRGILAAILPERLAAAREKLLALGVDAGQVFAEEGVPQELLVVAEVESGFDPRALSAKGARGLWQFMPETARRYGLRVDTRVDERLHVARSTRAAARYLRDLHLLFGDWQLALAAYNAGEQRLANAIERAGSRAFADLATRLPEETRRYVPAVVGGPATGDRGKSGEPRPATKPSAVAPTR